MTEPDISVGKSKGSESGGSDSSGGGGGGGGRRGTVHVKQRFGTEQYPPSTRCESCGDRAVGVMIHNETRRPDKMDTVKPLCRDDLEEYKDGEVPEWDEVEFRRFVDA